MAIAPIQRQRVDSGLQANIARNALQMVLQEQDARGQIMQEAQRINQLNLRRQDQQFRDIQQGYFTNRQFGANEEQRMIENDLRAAQEDRMQKKFEADMRLEPLREQQMRANIARTNRVAPPDSDLPSIGAPPITGRRSFESIDARVSGDGSEFAPRGAAPQTPAAPSAALFPQGSAPDAVQEEAAAPMGEPPRATPVQAPAAPDAPAAAPAAPQGYPADWNMQQLQPKEKLAAATAAASQAQQEIQQEKQQTALRQLELNPQQQQVTEAVSVFGDKWADATAQYFRNGNAEKALEQRKAEVKQAVMLEKVEVMGEDFGLGQWDAKKYAPYIKSLTTEERIMGKIPFQQAAMQSMLAAKMRRDPKVRNLTTADIEMIDKAWPAPDPDEINAKSQALMAEAEVLQLQDRYRAAKTPNERAIIENIARANDVFGSTGDDRDAVVNSALRELKTEIEAPELSTVQDAIYTMEYYNANPESRSKPWSPGDKDAVRSAELTLRKAKDAGMLTPDGALRASAAKSAGGQAAAAPVQIPAAPAQSGARKLLGIGKSASLTKPSR